MRFYLHQQVAFSVEAHCFRAGDLDAQVAGVRLGSDSEVEFELIFAAVGACVAVGDEVNSGQNAVGFCARVIGNACAPLRGITSDEVIGLGAKRGNSLPCDGGIRVIGGLVIGASGSPREGYLKPVMHRWNIAAGAKFAGFDFDPGAGQECRHVRSASKECHFG